MGMVEIRSVEKSYGTNKVIHGIDLNFAQGDFVVILGPSGCGKSTLLRMIAGLESITGGEIAIDGRVVNELEPRERDVSMVFQNYALYPHMSVRENMTFGLRLQKVDKKVIESKVQAVAETLGLSGLLDRRPGHLSGGQRQRVAMGRAIIREPKVFLFDEPLSNLDAKLRIQMRMELKRLHARLHATSVLVTHDQVEAMSLASRLVLMNGGTVEQVGTPTEVYNKPATLFAAGFVGSLPMNFFSGTLVDGGSRVQLENGVTLSLQNARPGAAAKVRVGIRPDAFRLEQAVPGQPGCFEGRLDLSEDLGGVRVLHVADGAEGFAVAVPPDYPVPEGRIVARVEEADLHVFDAATQRRI